MTMENESNQDPPADEQEQETPAAASGEGEEGQQEAGEQQEPASGEAPTGQPEERQPLTQEQARELAMDPALRQVFEEDMYRTIQALRGQEAAEATRAKVGKLIEDGNLEELGQLYKDQYEQSQQEAQIAQLVQNIQQEFYNTTFARLVQSTPELQKIDDEGRKRLDPSKFNDDVEYLKAVVDYVAEKRLDAGVQPKAHELLRKLAEAQDAEKAGAANQQAANQPLLPGASPGASLPKGASDLLNKAYAEAAGEEEE